MIQSCCPTAPNSTSDRRTSATLIRTIGSVVGGNGRRSLGSPFIGEAATGAAVATSFLPTSLREQAEGINAGAASANNAERRLIRPTLIESPSSWIEAWANGVLDSIAAS